MVYKLSDFGRYSDQNVTLYINFDLSSFCMKSQLKIFLFIMLSLLPDTGFGQNIFRFERMGSEDGLSQNTAFSILFDSKGFMWIGTMNGLNRYDGFEFKIYRSSSENGNNFTNNRISKLWEDQKGFIWLETYDGYYHFFNPESEVFTSLPYYEGTEIKNGAMRFFLQYSNDIILLGSSVSGLYVLKYDYLKNTYKVKQFTEQPGNQLSDNQIRFIHKDTSGNVWIGTKKGLNFTTQQSLISDAPSFSKQYSNVSFTSTCETANELWFGTENQGIIAYRKNGGSTRNFNHSNDSGLTSDNILNLFRTRNGTIIAGLADNGVMAGDSSGIHWKRIAFHSHNLGAVYEDRHGSVWLTAIEFGATRLDLKSLNSKYYELTPGSIKPLTDLERASFFEDSKGNLWLALHGSGLALYNRTADRFDFFRNDPKDANTISSNFVHCIAEDKSGQLWIGTGQVSGGIEKVILRNSAFEHFLPEKNGTDILDNVVRAVLEDRNKYLWVATKAGRLHLYDSAMKQINTFLSLPGLGYESLRNITYSIFLDNKDYLWIGSKGYGLSVSTSPLSRSENNYKYIRFRRFEHSEKDSASLSNNNIYSICQDKSNNIWIGTYGNGLNLIKDPYSPYIKFIRVNQKNSNLSSNLVRNVMSDSAGNLWVATTFGLNMLEKNDIETNNFRFRVFLHNTTDDKSLIYNDVIHLFQDSRGKLWFGTFGGGADVLQKLSGQKAVFKHFGSEAVQGYGIILGILEDRTGKIWFSSENGLIRLDPGTETSEIYNNFNGLGFNNFSENTCCLRHDGSLVFGGNLGFEVIRPDTILEMHGTSRIELTKFLLFNKEMSPNRKDSPLKKSISFSDNITLKYFQSSFSIEFSALNFLDPGKIEYSYKLDNFDANWNNTGNQHRATYTNLPPGKYLFRVKSVERNGTSASDERTLSINLLYPWWKTLPAYIVYVLILSIVAVFIYKTITRIHRYKNELIIEKKVNEYKLQFFTNISHEIRTPLTLIIGPLEDMLSESDITNKKRLQMEIMLKSARRMLHLTNQLLDFRKVQNNKMVLKISRLDIIAFTRDIYNSFVPLANHKGIIFSIDSPHQSFWIYADPNKLETIIYNIISNAIKFTKSGKRVSIQIAETEKNKAVDISVTDEGPGIPQRGVADIFTRYTILSNHELAGTGIGLSLSYELAKLHKGNILVTSAVGKGSIFTIRLLTGNDHFVKSEDFEADKDVNTKKPVDHSEDYVSNYEEDGSDVTDSADKSMILVVEDNQEILNYICQSLKSFFICIGAKNGSEGLHIARSLNPDVIITDIMMPEMDGLELTKILKEDFKTSHIPVIMLTSKANIRDQIEGIETGAEAYIVKPFNMEYLKTVATNLISQRIKVLDWIAEKKLAKTQLPAVNPKDQDFLLKLVSCIEEDHSNELSIENLAEFCNVSRTVFYNKIKGLTGSSPLDFVRKVKLNSALRLLESGYNVSEVAFMTGFTDVKYFSRLFKLQFGYSPSKHKADAENRMNDKILSS
jgi:signal transduction histidine kinase/ligand-binding sensor domain-containing protein/DNA-binding response OmpR family regulator